MVRASRKTERRVQAGQSRPKRLRERGGGAIFRQFGRGSRRSRRSGAGRKRLSRMFLLTVCRTGEICEKKAALALAAAEPKGRPMLFNSFVFIFAYLPVCLILFYQLGKRDRRMAAGFLAIA